MGIYGPDGAMEAILADGIAAWAADGRPSLKDELSVTWLRRRRARHGSDAGKAA